MSIKSQQQNMKLLSRLISRDLGYIYGERESGPNGAKKEFLLKSAEFLRTLDNDLYQPYSFLYRHITEMKDYHGGNNQWLHCSIFTEKDYETLLDTLMVLKNPINLEVDKRVA